MLVSPLSKGCYLIPLTVDGLWLFWFSAFTLHSLGSRTSGCWVLHAVPKSPSKQGLAAKGIMVLHRPLLAVSIYALKFVRRTLGWVSDWLWPALAQEILQAYSQGESWPVPEGQTLEAGPLWLLKRAEPDRSRIS